MAKLFYKDKPVVGIDISNTGIKIMSVDIKRWLVLGHGATDLDPIKLRESLDGKSTYLADNLKLLIKEKLIGKLPSNHVAVSIPTAKSFSRTFTLPTSVQKTIHDAVIIEAEQYIPVPLETLYVDYEIIERSKKEITVLMSAVPRIIIDSCIEALEAAEMRTVMIEPSISAVGRLITVAEDGQLPSLIVDIGPANTDIAVLDKGNIKVTGGLALGANTFTLDIAKKLNISIENAHQLKVLNGLSAGPRQEKISNALKPTLERLTVEIRKVMRYYDERLADGNKLEQLLIVGAGSNVPGIGEYFTNELVMPARVASPWQKLEFGKLPEPTKQFRSRYITVAGLASIQPGKILK